MGADEIREAVGDNQYGAGRAGGSAACRTQLRFAWAVQADLELVGIDMAKLYGN
jgi:hypothetical protein